MGPGSLKRAIEDYLESNPKKTLNWLSVQSGVGYSTLRRVCSGGEVQLETSLKVVEIIYKNTTEKMRFISENYSDYDQLFKAVYGKTPAGKEIDELDFEKTYRRKPIYSQIYQWSSNTEGITFEEVEKSFGAKGTKALEDMVDNGVIVKDKSRFRLCHKEYTLSDRSEILEIVRQDTDLGDFNPKNSLMAHFNCGINAQGEKKIRDVLIKTLADVQSIREQEEYQGRKPIFVDMLLGSFNNDCEEVTR